MFSLVDHPLLQRATALCLAPLLLFLLQACGPKTIEVLQEGMERGESVLIFRKPPVQTEWRKLGNPVPTAYFVNARPAGQGYVAITVPSGTYSLYSIFSRDQEFRSLRNTEPATAHLGTATVIKTPEKEEIVRIERIPARYEKRWHGKDWRYVMVRPPREREILDVHAIPSYWETSYIFPKDPAIGSMAGTIEIKPNEVVLVPSIWANAYLDENACRITQNQPNDRRHSPFMRETSRSYFSTADEFEEKEWLCPVKTLEIVIVPPSKEDFAARANPQDFPPGVLNRVETREFVPGPLFARPHKTEKDVDGTSRHIFTNTAMEEPASAGAKTQPKTAVPKQ